MRIAALPGPGRTAAASLCLAVTLTACAPGHGLGAQTLQATPRKSPASVLDSIMAAPPLHRAHWGVAVHDATSGATVLRHNADRLFTAASTMKLVTAAAALDLLGPGYRFETRVELEMDGAGRTDALVVRGGGDPTLGTPFHDRPLAPLDSLADSLAATGLRHVDGPVIVDQGRFDSTLVHPAWEAFDLDWYYAAPVAPFAVMGSAFEVVVTPGAVGELARVVLPHAGGLTAVDARVRTVAGPDDWDDVLRREPGRLTLRGTIGAGAGPDTSWIAQTDPGRVAGDALRAALEAAGIQVGGGVEVRYGTPDRRPGPAAGPVLAGPADGRRVVRVVWRSPPLDSILRVALERSDNWVTEQVLKTMAASRGDPGDWTGGTDLVEQYLVDTVGVSREAIYMRDGSGLTPQGLITPEAVVALLGHARERPWGPAFRDALASPGEADSTLEERLLPYGDAIAAKTGTLRHVNALSGYLRTRGGRELVFSILSNGSGRPAWEVQAALDRIVESLMENGS